MSRGSYTGDVRALADLLDRMENFTTNEQRARYLLSSDWLRDRGVEAAEQLAWTPRTAGTQTCQVIARFGFGHQCGGPATWTVVAAEMPAGSRSKSVALCNTCAGTAARSLLAFGLFADRSRLETS